MLVYSVGTQPVGESQLVNLIAGARFACCAIGRPLFPASQAGAESSMTQAETDSPKPLPRRLPIVPVLLALLLLGFALFGDRGILRALQAGRQKAALQEEVRQLEAANTELRQEIESLRNDRRYLEAIARKELGMVKDDELVYQFRSVQKIPRTAGLATPPGEMEAAPPPGQ